MHPQFWNFRGNNRNTQQLLEHQKHLKTFTTHSIVAISRHTLSLTYLTPTSDDTLSRWVRRIQTTILNRTSPNTESILRMQGELHHQQETQRKQVRHPLKKSVLMLTAKITTWRTHNLHKSLSFRRSTTIPMEQNPHYHLIY